MGEWRVIKQQEIILIWNIIPHCIVIHRFSVSLHQRKKERKKERTTSWLVRIHDIECGIMEFINYDSLAVRCL
jgi:hypothetical protein